MNKIFYIVFGLIAVASIAGLTTEFVKFDVQDFQFFGTFSEFDEAVCTCEGDDGTVSKENCQQFGGDIMDPNGVCILHPDVDIGDYGALPTLDQGCSVSFWKSQADESQVLSIWPAGYNPDDDYNDLFQTTIVSENENEEEIDDKVECIMNIAPEFGGCTAEEIAKKNQDKDKVKDNGKVKDKDSEDDDLECIMNIAPEFGGCTAEEIAKKNQDKDKVKDNGKVKDKDSEDDDTDEVKDEDSEDDDTDEGLTLLEALNAKHGKMGHLIRASVAALLNSAHSEVSYQYPVQEVISMTQDAINNENYQDAIDIFEELNEEGVRPPLCEDFDENRNAP